MSHGQNTNNRPPAKRASNRGPHDCNPPQWPGRLPRRVLQAIGAWPDSLRQQLRRALDFSGEELARELEGAKRERLEQEAEALAAHAFAGTAYMDALAFYVRHRHDRRAIVRYRRGLNALYETCGNSWSVKGAGDE